MMKHRSFMRRALQLAVCIAVATTSLAVARGGDRGLDPSKPRTGADPAPFPGKSSDDPPTIPGGDPPTFPQCGAVCGMRTVEEDDWGWNLDYVSKVVLCPKGTRALGGGAGSMGNSNYFYLSDSEPYFDPDDPDGWQGTPIGWRGTVILNSNLPENVAVQIGVKVWAFCATIQ